MTAPDDPVLPSDVPPDERRQKKRKKKKAAPGLPERDVQTWFRLTSKNLYTRRQQLDRKANIILSINAIVLGILAGTMYPQIQEDPWLILAAAPITIANLVGMFLAVRAMRPRLTGTGDIRPEDLEQRTARLMTFDDFYQMDEDAYVAAVDRVLEDQAFLHATMIRDIYRLGTLLSERYRLLSRAYNLFVEGMVASAVMFVLVELLTGRVG